MVRAAFVLFGQAELVARVEPLLQDDLAVFAFADVHGGRSSLQFVRHLLVHVDADCLCAFANGVRCHLLSLQMFAVNELSLSDRNGLTLNK